MQSVAGGRNKEEGENPVFMFSLVLCPLSFDSKFSFLGFYLFSMC